MLTYAHYSLLLRIIQPVVWKFYSLIIYTYYIKCKTAKRKIVDFERIYVQKRKETVIKKSLPVAHDEKPKITIISVFFSLGGAKCAHLFPVFFFIGLKMKWVVRNLSVLKGRII